MAFQVILAAAPTENLSEVWLSLDFLSREHGHPLFQGKLSFGESSSVRGKVFDFSKIVYGGNVSEAPLRNFVDTARNSQDKEPAIFNLQAHLHTGNEVTGFTLHNLASNDTFHLLALSRKLFLGNTFHGYPGMRGPRAETRCVATCEDGKSAQGCVTCTQGEITVKVCC